MSCAGLPMYDHACLSDHADRWWQGLARALEAEGVPDVPRRLERSLSREALWTAPDLLLAQTCGYPLMRRFRDHLTLVATPCYEAPGAADGYYTSRIVVARDATAQEIAELRGARAAVNSEDSHSGMNALRHTVAPLANGGGFFAEVKISGTHADSLALIRRGEADVAAIDCVSHALFAKHEPEVLEGIRVLAETAPAPALPYVTQFGADADRLARLRAGLRRALADPDLAEVRQALLLRDFVTLPDAAYERVITMEDEAAAAGYPLLA